MRRRLLLATILAVAVAVVLFGVPLAVFGANWVRQGADQRLQERIDGLIASVQLAQEVHLDVPDAALTLAATGVGDDPQAFVTVVMPDGTVYTSGAPIDGPTTEVSGFTDAGAEVSITISQWSRWLASAQVTAVVTALALVAVVAGALIARSQAQRISAPLVLLAASAEQLGAGQVRPNLTPSGIEEIDQVSAELARSSQRLAARLEAERQFTTDARHQMRTPLTALSMRLEEIQLITDDPEVAEEARIALDQVDRLVGVVDDLLAASRSMSSGNKVAVEVSGLTRKLGEEWTPIFAKAGRDLVIEVPEGERVLATPGQLSQVMATLVENSLRHGAGTTTVRLRQSGIGGSMTAIEVADEGPGVADAIADRIFERGFSTGGTGLGLALARNLAAADGGRLELAQRRPCVFALFLESMPQSSSVPVSNPSGTKWTGGPG